MEKRLKPFSLVALLSAGALVLAACGDDGGEDTAAPGDGNGETATESPGGEVPSEEIEIAAFDGWDEGIAVSHLWKVILTEEGYNVTVTMGGEAGVVYAGVANGDYDLEMDSWLPLTHSDYIDQYGDQLEELGTWYDNAKLTVAVNEDAPIQSLDQLAENAGEFGNEIVGIEPGAGLTRITREEVIPEYGLGSLEFTPSSTPAMLAELDSAIAANENIVVTLWRPHWAYTEYPIRDLEDPAGALGEAEDIRIHARSGFSDDFPQVAEWMGNFQLNDEELSALENIMMNENQGEQNDESAQQWLEENPDFVEQLKAGEL